MIKKQDLVRFSDNRVIGIQHIFEVKKITRHHTFVFVKSLNRNIKVDHTELKYVARPI